MTSTTLPEFNPSQDDRVTKIKAAVEEVIKYLDDPACSAPRDGRRASDPRCRAIAKTKLEEAAMWAVKSFFV